MKVHVIGIAGSGKTTLARWLSEAFDVAAYDLDRVVYDAAGRERGTGDIAARVAEIRAERGWVTEGAYGDAWLLPLLDGADTIVWLDMPFRTCAARLVTRHLRAELAGTNAHPGWWKLARFLNYTRGTRGAQRRRTSELLAPYRSKVVRCRSFREVAALRIETAKDRSPGSQIR